VDERARNHATLFAFGLRVRRVVAMIVEESVVIGMASTVVGLALGAVLLRWMVTSLLAETVPEIGIVMYLSWTTVLTALALGVAAVGLTPLLLVRRLIRMDIPDTLRIME
jgi:putative ABC transport system permease protein